MNRCILLLAFGLLVSVVAVHGHHSIAGVYDTSQQVRIEGIVAQFHFVNPHPFITLDVKNAGGGAEQWRLEMDNRSELAQIGMTGDTLRQGDRVVVTGSPGRALAQSLYIRRLDRATDGFSYEQVGSSPKIRTRR